MTTKISSYCHTGGCVAVTPSRPGGVWVHRSDTPPTEGLLFSADEWAAFLAGVRDGQFDLGVSAD